MQKLIQKLKELKVLSGQKVKLSHAGDSNYYIDIKKAYGDPEVLNLIVKLLSSKISKDATCVAASGHGGLPLAGALAVKYGLKLTMVRNQPKEHGLNKLIDGHVPRLKDKIIIVDDVITTGGSIKQIAKALQSTEAQILEAWVVVKRGESKLSIPCNWLITIEDLK